MIDTLLNISDNLSKISCGAHSHAVANLRGKIEALREDRNFWSQQHLLRFLNEAYILLNKINKGQSNENIKV